MMRRICHRRAGSAALSALHAALAAASSPALFAALVALLAALHAALLAAHAALAAALFAALVALVAILAALFAALFAALSAALLAVPSVSPAIHWRIARQAATDRGSGARPRRRSIRNARSAQSTAKSRISRSGIMPPWRTSHSRSSCGIRRHRSTSSAVHLLRVAASFAIRLRGQSAQGSHCSTILVVIFGSATTLTAHPRP